MDVTGRDKLLWVVVDFPDGSNRQSQKLYSTSGVDLFATITNENVNISHVSRANQTVERDAPKAARRSP
jgi:hypothetical protein